MLEKVVVLLIIYLIGSIPTSYIVGKLVKGIDIRKHGSGNVGATNTFRVLGARWGILVLAIDILKGYLPVYWVVNHYHSQIFSLMAAVVVILGHIFTIFLGFKGGKGVATSLGVFLVLSPKPVVASLIVFLILFLATGYVSLGSISAAISFPLFYCKFYGYNYKQDYVLWLSLIVAVLIVFRHRSNIKRLLKGKERRFYLWRTEK